MRAGLPLLLLVLGACGNDSEKTAPTAQPAAVPARAPIRFSDVTRESGVSAIAWCGRPLKPHILESGGTGLALFDYDSDGDLDLYLVSGWRLDGAEIRDRARNVLYRNRGDGTFEDVTERAGVGDDGWGCGVAVGDVDGDGQPDLFVSNFGPDTLYRNRGDGTFERVANPPGIDGWSTGAVFFDADGDGDEDLYVAAYIDCTLDQVLHAKPTLAWKGNDVMLGPFGLRGKENRYFENVGGGKFVDATKKAGLVDVGEFYSFGVLAIDIDDDDDLDLYVANDSNPNYVYRNDGKGVFKEVGLWSGAALDGDGAAQAGMGLASGDYDGDGDPDILVTNFALDASTLYQNRGDCLFSDVSTAACIKQPTFAPLSWGAAFADFDSDGDLDLFIANGHIYPQADTTPTANTTFRQTNLLLANDKGRFRDVSADAGSGLAVSEASHGLAGGDIDGDGDVDVVIANIDAPPSILRNETAAHGNWLLVDAPGARRVEISAGGRRWVAHRAIGGSFLSVSDPRFHFGLGEARTIDRMLVAWPGGVHVERKNVAVNRVVRVDPPR
jgi:hypothetical protein